MAKGSLVTHRTTQHGVAKWGLGPEGNEADGVNYPRTHRMEFPEKAEPITYPVNICSVRTSKQTVMRVHFCHWNVRNTVVILEEGNLHHPQCPLCEILVPWSALNGMHQCIAQLKQVEEQKRQKSEAEEEREVTVRALSAYRCYLDMVTSFRYLGWVISVEYNYWPAVVRNLSRARFVWKRMTRILIRVGGVPKVSGFFFKYLVQVVLLFGSVTWVVTPCMGKALGEVSVPGGEMADEAATT